MAEDRGNGKDDPLGHMRNRRSPPAALMENGQNLELVWFNRATREASV